MAYLLLESGSKLLLEGGGGLLLEGGGAPAPACYVDPDAGTLIDDGAPGAPEIDPDAGTVINQ